ncbi:hypothetical protein BZG36_02582 [Bifiguratus adelaidae]|uniref:GATA-type domain-containing protein n=1 Tax=Bifiguratus adelaidae TaxID=1938954 RepID=A0A261Y116_9FUNG|nr:hypothetical protein BZG36_02582 [Bifiguratus adelaidae]
MIRQPNDDDATTQRRWLELVLDQTHDFIHVISLKGIFLYCSPAANALLDYEPEVLIGRSISSVCHPSDIVAVMRELKQSKQGETVDIVYRARRQHGGYIWVECQGNLYLEAGKGRKSLILSARERPVYRLTWTDVWNARADTQVTAVKEEDRMNRADLVQEDDLWSKMSLDGLFMYCGKMPDVLGYTVDELVGMSIYQLTRSDSVTDVTKALLQAREGNTLNLWHYMQGKKGAYFRMQSTFYPGDVDGSEQKPAILIVQTRQCKDDQRELSSASTESSRSPATIASSPDPILILNTPSPNIELTVLYSSNCSEENRNILKNNAKKAKVEDVTQSVTYTPGASSSDLLTSENAKSGLRDDNIFDELVSVRSTSWQFELHQLQLTNKKLRNEVQALSEEKKKRRYAKHRRADQHAGKVCLFCGRTDSPEWRRGPNGTKELCNACGLRYAKNPKATPPLEHVYKFKVGMSCEGCSGAVKRVVSKLDGVQSIDADLPSQTVTVHVSGDATTQEKVFESIKKTGKPVEPEPIALKIVKMSFKVLDCGGTLTTSGVELYMAERCAGGSGERGLGLITGVEPSDKPLPVIGRTISELELASGVKLLSLAKKEFVLLLTVLKAKGVAMVKQQLTEFGIASLHLLSDQFRNQKEGKEGTDDGDTGTNDEEITLSHDGASISVAFQGIENGLEDLGTNGGTGLSKDAERPNMVPRMAPLLMNKFLHWSNITERAQSTHNVVDQVAGNGDVETAPIGGVWDISPLASDGDVPDHYAHKDVIEPEHIHEDEVENLAPVLPNSGLDEEEDEVEEVQEPAPVVPVTPDESFLDDAPSADIVSDTASSDHYKAIVIITSNLNQISRRQLLRQHYFDLDDNITPCVRNQPEVMYRFWVWDKHSEEYEGLSKKDKEGTAILREFDAERVEWGDVIVSGDLSTESEAQSDNSGARLSHREIIAWVESSLTTQGITYEYIVIQDSSLAVNLPELLESFPTATPIVPTPIVRGTFSASGPEDDIVIINREAVIEAMAFDAESSNLVDTEPEEESGAIFTQMKQYYDQRPPGSSQKGTPQFETMTVPTAQDEITTDTEPTIPENGAIALMTSSFIYADNCMLPASYLAGAQKRLYAESFGHPFIARSQEFAKQQNLKVPRKTVWGKIDAIQDVLPHYEWIFWMDMDAVIMNPTKSLSDHLANIKLASGLSDAEFNQKHLIISRPRGDKMINAGVFYLRNSDWSRQFLENVQNTESWWNNGPSYEQGAMWDVLGAGEDAGMSGGMLFLDQDDHTFNTFPKKYRAGDFIVHYAPDACPAPMVLEGLEIAKRIQNGEVVESLVE